MQTPIAPSPARAAGFGTGNEATNESRPGTASQLLSMAASRGPPSSAHDAFEATARLLESAQAAAAVADGPARAAIVAEVRAQLPTPDAVAAFLHAAHAARIDTPGFTQFLQDAGFDAAVLALYLGGSSAVDATAARRQYQTVIAAQTRMQTFDVFMECGDAYARLAVLLASANPPDVWEHAVTLAGEFDLEPFRVFSMFVDACVRDKGSARAQPDALTAALRALPFRGHADAAYVLSTKVRSARAPQGVPMLRLQAELVASGFVTLEQLYVYLHAQPAAFDSFAAEWRASNRPSAPATNALAMAMPLADSEDDEAEGEEGAEAEVDGDASPKGLAGEAASESGTANQARPELVPETDASSEAAERVLNFVGMCMDVLAGHNELPSAHAATLERQLLALAAATPTAASMSGPVCHGRARLGMRRLSNASSSTSLGEVVRVYYEPGAHDVPQDAWSALDARLAALRDAESVNAQELFRRALLPSLDLCGAESAYLALLAPRDRYALYADLQTRISKDNELVEARFARAEKGTKDLLKRLTKRDAEAAVPQLVDAFARCPLPSLLAFVNQVESYNIGKLVARHATLSARALDTLPLILMQQLTLEGKQAQQQDGLHENRWFKLLAQFIGDVAAANQSFDFVSIVRLVLAEFVHSDYTMSPVLSAIVGGLSGVPSQTNLSVPQVLALNSEPALRACARADISGQLHPQSRRLVSSLQQDDLAEVLLAALARALTTHAEGDAKVTARRKDSAGELLYTYIEVLSAHCDFALDRLASLGLPLPYAFALFRASAQARIEDVRATLPSQPELYAQFWFHGLYDLSFEAALYTSTFEHAALKHKLRAKSVRQKLTSARDILLSAPMATAIVHDLLVPRIVMSPGDGIYASRFVQALYDIKVPNFDLTELCDALLQRSVILALLGSCSPNEIESVALFLTDFFVFLLTTEDLSLLRSCHKSLTFAMIEVAYPDAAYTVLANILVLLQRTRSVFPMYEDDGLLLLERVEDLSQNVKDKDLEVASKSLYPQLLQKTSTWIASTDATTQFSARVAAEMQILTTRLHASIAVVASKIDLPAAEADTSRSIARNAPQSTARSSEFSDSRNARSPDAAENIKKESVGPQHGSDHRVKGPRNRPARDTRDARDSRDARDMRDTRDTRDSRDRRDNRERDSPSSRQAPKKPSRASDFESRSDARSSESHDHREDDLIRKDTVDTRDIDGHGTRAAKDSRDDRRSREYRDSRGSKTREPRRADAYEEQSDSRKRRGSRDETADLLESKSAARTSDSRVGFRGPQSKRRRFRR